MVAPSASKDQSEDVTRHSPLSSSGVPPAASSLGSDFDRFLAASAVSNLGDGIRVGALPLLALSFTSDARLISFVVAASMLPWLVLGPIGGALVDRVDRRRLIVVSQLARAAFVGILLIGIATGAANIWWLIVVAFGLGAGEILVDTSSQASATTCSIEPTLG